MISEWVIITLMLEIRLRDVTFQTWKLCKPYK